MIRLIITTIIVFVLNILLSNVLDKFFIILPIILLVKTYHYFNNRDAYLVYAFIIGLLYEIIFLNSIIIYGIFFLALALLIRFLYRNIDDYFWGNVYVYFIALNTFLVTEYLGLIIINYTNFNLSYFLMMLLRSNFINLLFFMIASIKFPKRVGKRHKYPRIS